eukprot:TRINITY_DN2961_c0_g1_i1.p1 TRINITY_DN2961_c0_g1~~TRINITY_DN2961_c0_g1_i1.p1  ORF type:complete len:190 (-),score=13.40 TRINITY_DN2961_c0_g1_i1:385-954(-)
MKLPLLITVVLFLAVCASALDISSFSGWWRNSKIDYCSCSRWCTKKSGSSTSTYCCSYTCYYKECTEYIPVTDLSVVYNIDSVVWHDYYNFSALTGYTDGDKGPQLFRFRVETDDVTKTDYQVFAINKKNSYLNTILPPLAFKNDDKSSIYDVFKYERIPGASYCKTGAAFTVSAAFFTVLLCVLFAFF